MANFWKVLNDVVRKSDVVLEVLDARMPDLTRNKELEDKITQPIIYVLNKCDLISKEEGERLKKQFKGKSVFVSTKKYYGIKMLKSKINKLVYDKKKVRIGVVGYPNTGKSSLINALSNRGAAKTSPQSGYTRGQQLIKLNKNMYLIDTPGVIPYKEKDEVKHGMIASADPDHIKNPDIVAMEILNDFLENDKRLLEKQYKIKIEKEMEDEYDVLIKIGKSSNLLKKGGDVDERRTAVRIIQDWQRGKINKNKE